MLTCILIARHCFSLEDFVGLVALPSLLKVRRISPNTAFYNNCSIILLYGNILYCLLVILSFNYFFVTFCYRKSFEVLFVLRNS